MASHRVILSAIGPRHARRVNRLARSLSSLLAPDITVSVENPVRLDLYHEPQPDIAILRPRADDYEDSLPEPADVLLTIEVSDTTLAYDRGVRLPMYARAAIAEAWIVDVPGNAVERHTDPHVDGYRLVLRTGADEMVASTVLPELVLHVGDVLACG